MPKPSPIAPTFGSFHQFVGTKVLPDVAADLPDRAYMIAVVSALRAWEQDGTWKRAET